MKHFKRPEDLVGLTTSPLVLAIAREIVTHLATALAPYGGWDPARDGWVALLETPEDLQEVAQLNAATAASVVPFEAVEHNKEAACFVASCLFNNDFCMSYVIPFTICDKATREYLAAEADAFAGVAQRAA